MDLFSSFAPGALVDNPAVVRNIIASAVLLVAVMALRHAAVRFIHRTNFIPPSSQLRWRVQARWVALLLLALGLAVVWASELRTLALSFVAIGAALVLATKELVLCLLGGIVRASSGSFRVGDRVEVAGVSGEVIDIRPLTTTLMEIGPGHQRTGRTLVLPNVVFLTTTVANETFSDDYLLHAISVPLPTHDGWQEARQALLEVTTEVCAPYLAEARKEMDATARHHGLPPLPVDPTVILRIPDRQHLELVVRVPTPARQRAAIEQQILERFLVRWQARPGS
jgi:small-conductance mechanosensitive channel